MSELALKLIDENKWTKVGSLNLSELNLKQLPPEISTCVWLNRLTLNGNAELSDLSPLKYLQNLLS